MGMGERMTMRRLFDNLNTDLFGERIINTKTINTDSSRCVVWFDMLTIMGWRWASGE